MESESQNFSKNFYEVTESDKVTTSIVSWLKSFQLHFGHKIVQEAYLMNKISGQMVNIFTDRACLQT